MSANMTETEVPVPPKATNTLQSAAAGEDEESPDVSQLNKTHSQQMASKATVASVAETGVPVPSPESEEFIHNSQLHKVQRRVSATGDLSYHPGVSLIPPFAPPRQRQKWGDTQILPRTNWGDIFFDLFYVGAAYNAGNIIVASPTGMGLLYFLGAFVPLVSVVTNRFTL